MYSMMGTFRGHMSLKSSPFSPGPSCKLSNQYIIQDHMAAHYKKLMSAKAAVDSSAPKSLHTSVKFYEGIVSGDVSSIDVHEDGLWPKISCSSELLEWVAYKGELIPSFLPPGETPLNSFETSFLFQNSSGVKHQPTFLKHLVGIKPELPLRAKTEGMSQDNDQQKRDRLIQALEKYKKNLVHGLPASPFKSRSVSPSQQKAMWSPLENSHLYLMSGQNNCSRTKREQPPSVSFQKFTSGTLMSAPTARKTIQNTARRALSQTPVHSPGTDRSPASPLLHSHRQLGSHNKQNALPNSHNKTYSGDLLDKHSIYFTEKKQLFTPQILKTSHQSLLVKHRYYNPPPRRRGSSPSRSSLKSAGINNGKKRELHRLLEDAHMRPHSYDIFQQPAENPELWIPNSEMLLSLGSQLEENDGEYLRFLQDLTNDILIRSCYHEEALEDVFQMHIKSKRHNLDEVKRRKIVQSLKKELNITNHPDPSISCKDASIPATCF